MTKHRQKIEDAFRAMDDHRYDQLATFQALDCSYRMNYDTIPGLAGFVEMCKGWYGGFPDLRHEVLEYGENGDHVAYTLRITGTHTATMQTPQGPVPATGKRIDFRALDHVTFGPDGKARTWNGYFDMLTVLQQLGLA